MSRGRAAKAVDDRVLVALPVDGERLVVALVVEVYVKAGQGRLALDVEGIDVFCASSSLRTRAPFSFCQKRTTPSAVSYTASVWYGEGPVAGGDDDFFVVPGLA